MENRYARANAEYSGKTLEEALRKASADLKVPVEDLAYQVISDTTRSLLGFVLRGEVTIHAWVPEKATRPAQEDTEKHPSVTEAKEEIPASAKGNPPELEEVAIDVLTTLLDKMGILAAVEVVDHGGKIDPETGEVSPLSLNIVGDELGILIGRRGETLRDLQFITRLIVSRKIGTWPNLVVDIENYKARRVKSLQALARRMADQVRRTKQPVILEPMPAHERRIIHLTLRNDPDVYTESTGQDENRKVQILPK